MRVAVVGSGYVGLTTAACLTHLGHDVRCVDLLPERVETINAGQPPFHEPGFPELLAEGLAAGRLRATSDLREAVAASEVTFIAVGTPEGERGIDLSYVARAARDIGTAVRDVTGYHVVVVKSTVVPGTTDTLVRSLLEEHSGDAAGAFGLCMNPEFLREGSAVEDFLNPDRIVIGQWDERSGQTVARLYESFECPIVFTSVRNAEMTKYASNALLATLISFSNELAALCEATPGTCVQDVLRCLHLDRRLTPVVDGRPVQPGILSFLWAGCGFGGSCLPKDVNALRAFARQRGVDTRLLDAVMAVNRQRPLSLVDLVEQAAGSLDGASVAVLGLAFKPGTDDLRRSPALPVIEELVRRDCRVRVFDPILTVDGALPPLSDVNLESELIARRVTAAPTAEATLRGADAAVVVTACPEFVAWNWTDLLRAMRQPIVVDGRNVLENVEWPSNARYLPVGQAFNPASQAMTAGYGDDLDRTGERCVDEAVG